MKNIKDVNVWVLGVLVHANLVETDHGVQSFLIKVIKVTSVKIVGKEV